MKDLAHGLRLTLIMLAASLCSAPAAAIAKPTCGIPAVGLPARTQAISSAIRGDEADAIRAAGNDQFLIGFAAYLTHDYPLALSALSNSAQEAAMIKDHRARSDGLARAGYWASRTLEAQGRFEEAAVMRTATTEQKGTFYALLIDVGQAIPQKTSYPSVQALYTDPRASQALVFAITREESGFNANARSGAGAHGAMQVIDSTAKRVASWVGASIDLNKMHSDFNYNSAIGSTYLGWLIERYNNYPALAAAAYNAGEGCSDKWIEVLGDPRGQVDPLTWIEAIPLTETRNYVLHVMSTMVVYIYYGANQAAN